MIDEEFMKIVRAELARRDSEPITEGDKLFRRIEKRGKTDEEWLKTQQFRTPQLDDEQRTSWLMDIPELYARRAPGNTCMDIIGREKHGSVKQKLQR